MLTYFGRLWGLIPKEEEIDKQEMAQETVVEEERYYASRSSRNVNDIEIEGEEKFVRYIQNCLYEITKHGNFEGMVSELKKIKQVQNWSDVGMGSDGVFSVNYDVCSYYENDFIWGASQIIHDSKHYERMVAGKFDRTNYVGEELIAFVPQAEFLRDCNRHSQVEYIESQDGRHVLDRVNA